MARKDTEWGAQAIFQMVEIYLNPDHEAVWDEANEGNHRPDNANAVDAAMRLLGEVRHPRPRSVSCTATCWLVGCQANGPDPISCRGAPAPWKLLRIAFHKAVRPNP